MFTEKRELPICTARETQSALSFELAFALRVATSFHYAFCVPIAVYLENKGLVTEYKTKVIMRV